jgi:ABC-2 type transport system permease protein
VNLRGQLISLWTLGAKEYQRVMRIWIQTLVPPAITMTLYFLIFGTLIGRRIGQMSGFDYMEYIAPGLILMSVITNSYGNVVSSFFSAKYNRHLEEMLVAPMPHWAIVLGHMLGGMLRGLLVGLLVTLIALFFTRLHVSNLFVALSVLVLTSAVFSLGGLINAVFARKFDDVSIIPSFVLAPLTYLGGVFYSVSLLPGFAQDLSLLNPILYMVNAFRYGVLGVSDIDIGAAYLIILAFLGGLFALSLVLINRGIGIRE